MPAGKPAEEVVKINRAIYYEYEQLLLGHTKELSSFVFPESKEMAQKMVLDIFRYAFESYLGWTPEDVRDNTDMSVLDIMKLRPLLKFITFPPEADDRLLFLYIASMLYPERIRYGEKEAVISIYKRINSKGPDRILKYPKEFFSGLSGKRRLKMCFGYMLENFLPVTRIEVLYQIFGGAKGVRYLKRYKLMSACQNMYDSPLEMLHDTLSEEQRDEYLFRWWTVHNASTNVIELISRWQEENVQLIDGRKKQVPTA